MSTVTISAADVNKLRLSTGAGMMDCKKALIETNGDFEAAIDVLQSKLFKRGVSIRALTYGKIQQASKGTVRQEITILQGIPQDKAKIFVNGIKEKKFKVQVTIQGDQLRISGKDKDTLQEVIAFIRQEQNRANIDVQIVNLRG